jgi:small-conductance mechanosensitive channel
MTQGQRVHRSVIAAVLAGFIASAMAAIAWVLCREGISVRMFRSFSVVVVESIYRRRLQTTL